MWILLCQLGKNEKSIKPNNMSTKEEPKPIKVSNQKNKGVQKKPLEMINTYITLIVSGLTGVCVHTNSKILHVRYKEIFIFPVVPQLRD